MLVAVLVLCLTLTGCSSSHFVPFQNLQPNEVPALSQGDEVRVMLKGGQVRRLKVATADRETITGLDLDAKSGASIQLSMADIQSLEVREVNAGKTVGLVVGIVAAVAAVLIGLFLIQCQSPQGQCTA